MNPLVSIVIPTYNRARDLKRALTSVIAQTYLNWECLVVDNHSNDDTDAMVEQFHDSRIKLFKIHNNGVIAASRNLGIQHAVGKYIAFLDSDDWWVPIKLEKSVYYLEQNADVVYHGLQCVKKNNSYFFRKKVGCRSVNTPVYNDLILNGNALANSSVVLRRELLKQLGGLSEAPNLIAAEDYEYWLRLAKLTNKFVHIPEILGYYWIGDNMSNSTRSSVNLKELEKLHLLPYVTEHQVKMPIWWEYASGRAWYLLGDHCKAQKHLIHLLEYKLSWLQRMKVYCMVLMSWGKRKYDVRKK